MHCFGAPGEGFYVAMWALDGGRVAIAEQALGVGSAALDEALDYARRREAFGEPIGNYQAVQWMLAEMATELDAARMLTLTATDTRQRGARPALDAAMAKLFASEAAHRAADKAMQTQASRGDRRGSVVERLACDGDLPGNVRSAADGDRRTHPDLRNHRVCTSPICNPSTRPSSEPGMIWAGTHARGISMTMRCMRQKRGASACKA